MMILDYYLAVKDNNDKLKLVQLSYNFITDDQIIGNYINSAELTDKNIIESLYNFRYQTYPVDQTNFARIMKLQYFDSNQSSWFTLKELYDQRIKYQSKQYDNWIDDMKASIRFSNIFNNVEENFSNIIVLTTILK